MGKVLILLIKSYRLFFSAFLGDCCRFYPSCSLYAQIAIERYGTLYGSWLTLRRLLRCHPGSLGGFDPVPEHCPPETR